MNDGIVRDNCLSNTDQIDKVSESERWRQQHAGTEGQRGGKREVGCRCAPLSCSHTHTHVLPETSPAFLAQPCQVAKLFGFRKHVPLFVSSYWQDVEGRSPHVAGLVRLVTEGGFTVRVVTEGGFTVRVVTEGGFSACLCARGATVRFSYGRVGWDCERTLSSLSVSSVPSSHTLTSSPHTPEPEVRPILRVMSCERTCTASTTDCTGTSGGRYSCAAQQEQQQQLSSVSHFHLVHSFE